MIDPNHVIRTGEAADSYIAELRQQLTAAIKRAEKAEVQVTGAGYAAQMLRQSVGLDNTKEDLHEVALLFDSLKRQLAELTADRDSWREQAEQRVKDAVEALRMSDEWRGVAEKLADALRVHNMHRRRGSVCNCQDCSAITAYENLLPH